MFPLFSSFGTHSVGLPPQARALRDIYALSALCLISTMAGASLGLCWGPLQDLRGWQGLVLVAAAVAGMGALLAAMAFRERSAWGSTWLVAHTFLLGGLLSQAMGMALAPAQALALVLTVFSATSTGYFTVAARVHATKREMPRNEQALATAVALLAGLALAALLVQPGPLVLTLAALGSAGSFLFVGTGIERIQKGRRPNVVRAALACHSNIVSAVFGIVLIWGLVKTA